MHYNAISATLYVGTCPMEAGDVDALARLGVTAVLNVQTDEDLTFWGICWEDLEAQYRDWSITVRRVPVRDFDPDALRCGLPDCVRALDELIRAGHTVYVHCSAGINRSPSTVIAYLHWIAGWELSDAVAHVMNCRACDPYVEAIEAAGEDREQLS
jgi:protein tyrosine phosphatase (PTP) superfamily phosphohydrolase (DUF442 family)